MGATLDGVLCQFRERGMPELGSLDLRADSKKHVYGPKKKAWYRLNEFTSTKSGKVWISGVFGHKDEWWKVENDGSFQMMTPEERDAAKREWERREREHAEREQRLHQLAANRAKDQWRQAARAGASPYLARKQVADPESVRFMSCGSVIIPLLRYDLGQMVGAQKIAPDGAKRFNYGMEKVGAACRLGDEPVDGDLIGVAEGYATAASARLGLEYEHPVYMALDAGNLEAVAKILRAKYPSSPLLLIGDDDYLTGEPGRIKAERAAAAAGNATVVLPAFTVPRAAAKEGDSLPMLTDFNDLHCAEGIEPVRDQLRAAICTHLSPPPLEAVQADAAEMAPDNDTRGAGDNGDDELYKYFALVDGKTRAYDKRTGQDYTMPALKHRFGKKLVDAWLERPDKLLVTQAEVSVAKKAREEKSRRADIELVPLMKRYIYLDGSASIWDAKLREVIPANAARLAMGGAWDIWIDSPDRTVIPLANVRFAPGADLDPVRFINLYTGMEMEPEWPAPHETMPRDIWHLITLFPKCQNIIALAYHLCDGRNEVFEWLMNWIAYPLQHIGAKLDTAILMHGSVHGSGKSMFWEKVVKALFGRYAITLGQDQLESQYTGSRSAKLFLLFEEVISSKQRYSQTGKLKHMITGMTQVIEKKFMNAWEESNHANCVFLSNAIQPLHIEAHDRRFQVIWPLETAPEEIYIEVDREVSDGGLEAFLAFLMALPLTLTVEACPERLRTGDKCPPACPHCHGIGMVKRSEPIKFDAHSKPLMTEEKARVIRYGLSGWELFVYQWKRGEIDSVPFVSCPTRELFLVYRKWCEVHGENPISENKFSINVGVACPGEMSKKKGARWRGNGYSPKQGAVFKVGLEPKTVAEMDYLGEHIAKFRVGARLFGVDLGDDATM